MFGETVKLVKSIPTVITLFAASWSVLYLRHGQHGPGNCGDSPGNRGNGPGNHDVLRQMQGQHLELKLLIWMR